jgi:WD40 repeat protein
VVTPGRAPAAALARGLAPELATDRQALQDLIGCDEPDVLVGLFGRWRRAHKNALLVVDQFEELFTLNLPEAQGRFAALLARLAVEADVHVLLSLRDDFLIHCHEQEALAGVFDHLTPMLPLVGPSLRRALEEPAKKEGYAFEDTALVDEMLTAVEGERGALPLLAFAVSRLWEKRDREKGVLTRAAYHRIGGVSGALAQHAEAVLERIGADRERLVREVFRNLVTSQGTRAACEREELLSAFPARPEAEDILRQIIDARLLTSFEVEGKEGEPGPHRIEIVHESLLKAWPRLVRWQAQDEEGAVLRDQLRQAAHLWEEKGRTPDLLWTGTAHREFELWRERYPGALTALEEEFARAMTDRARRRRRLRRLVVGSVLTTAVIVAGVMGPLWRRSSLAGEQAATEALRAEASKLLALAQLRLADDPTEALAFTTASLELADSKEARLFAVKALSEAPPAMELDPGGSDNRVPAFSPDGRWVAVAGHSTEVRVFSEDGKQRFVLPGHDVSPQGPNVVAWARQDLLMSGLNSGLAERVHAWSVPDGSRLSTIEFGAKAFWQVAPGILFARTVEGPQQRLHVLRSWALPDGRPTELGQVDWAALGASSAAFAPDGRSWLYTKGPAIFIRPLPLRNGQRYRLLDRHESGVNLEPRAEGTIIARDGAQEIRVWPFARTEPERARVLRRPHGEPDWWRPDPSGRWLLGSAWLDTHLRLWDASAIPGARPLALRRSGSWYGAWAECRPRGDWTVISTAAMSRLTFWPLPSAWPSIVDGYKALARPVAFSPASDWLATSWADRALRLWPLPGNSGSQVRRLGVPVGVLWASLAFDPMGRYLFAVGNSDHAWIVPLDGSPARKLPAFSEDTLICGAAVSPSGRRVAWAFCYGRGPKTLRVWDTEAEQLRLLELPPHVPPSPAGGDTPQPTGYESQVASLAFADETTLYSGGDGGIRRWDLTTGSQELVLATEPDRVMHNMSMVMSSNPQRALVYEFAFAGRPVDNPFRLQDLKARTSRVPEGFGRPRSMALDRSGTIAVTGDVEGILRVGRLDGGEPHVLAGHAGQIGRIAISPDLRWIASTGEDNTLRIWPMPDLSKPPLHALPHDELLAKLKSLTNLRAVRDPVSATGWKIELGPFPGWKHVPTWWAHNRPWATRCFGSSPPTRRSMRGSWRPGGARSGERPSGSSSDWGAAQAATRGTRETASGPVALDHATDREPQPQVSLAARG